jgi:hypothetical protein
MLRISFCMNVKNVVNYMNISVAAKAGLYLDTLDAQRLKKIRDLEAYERPSKAEVEPQAQKPVFITPLNRYDREIHLHGRTCKQMLQKMFCSLSSNADFEPDVFL